jgi:hypothetical protein
MLRYLRYLLFKACLRWFRAVVDLDRIERTTGDEHTEIEQKETKQTKNSKGNNHRAGLGDSAPLFG